MDNDTSRALEILERKEIDINARQKGVCVFLFQFVSDFTRKCVIKGWTALFLACVLDRREMIELLLNHCADPTIPSQV